MKDKYIIYFISRTKANMIKFIENKLKENDLTELIPTHGNILTALYESDKKLTMKEIAQKNGQCEKNKASSDGSLRKCLFGCFRLHKRYDKLLFHVTLYESPRINKSRHDSLS